MGEDPHTTPHGRRNHPLNCSDTLPRPEETRGQGQPFDTPETLPSTGTAPRSSTHKLRNPAAGREVGVSRHRQGEWSRGYKVYRHGRLLGRAAAGRLVASCRVEAPIAVKRRLGC